MPAVVPSGINGNVWGALQWRVTGTVDQSLGASGIFSNHCAEQVSRKTWSIGYQSRTLGLLGILPLTHIPLPYPFVS